MQATAVSKTVSSIGLIIRIIDVLLLVINMEFLNNVSNRCPAIRFAVNRTHRVIGRIMLLIISINTIKDTKAVGVPCGTR